jgi:putative NADH-flavin reductase
LKLFVLGATGDTGRLFTKDALAAGHEVTAYVRSPDKIAPRAGLRVTAGDVLDPGAVAEAMRGADAVVSMLGLRSARPDGFSESAQRAIVGAAQRSGTSRVLVMSAFGVGESRTKASWLARLMYNTGGKAIYADKAAGEKILTASGLDWTLAYPVLLTNQPKSSSFTAIDLARLDHLPGLPRVPRADVAGFLLDAAVSVSWVRRTAVLTTGGSPISKVSSAPG